MNHISTLLLLALCISSTLVCAPRRSIQEKDAANTQQPQQAPQVIMVPVPVQQTAPATYTQAQQDRDIMLSLTAMLVNAGHVFLNAGKEKPFPTQQVGNWLNSINHIAEVVTRGKKQRTALRCVSRRCL